MRAIWRGIWVFLIAWTLFACLARLLGDDLTGDPATDAAHAAQTYLLGPVIIGGSVVLGLLEFFRLMGDDR